ncbi:hypothetical protein EDC05_005733 [Coemansia umbellata]|uniref:Uncharacterized protein n=1 Tax=Coemansia umbellata TaxID=1424467 RepID=A0ABQ8PHH0_9FUNG|nr:hypothetical protein EDC05_005733 [Coemansia umbellata]
MGSDKRNPISDYPGGLIDFTESSRAAGPMLLYCFMGAIDAYYQSFAYWIIGTMTNRPQMLARYAGFYKEIQSMAMGAVVAWQLDAKHVKLLTQVIINWMLFNFMAPFTHFFTSNISNRSDKHYAPEDSNLLVPASDCMLDERRWSRVNL